MSRTSMPHRPGVRTLGFRAESALAFSVLFGLLLSSACLGDPPQQDPGVTADAESTATSGPGGTSQDPGPGMPVSPNVVSPGVNPNVVSPVQPGPSDAPGPASPTPGQPDDPAGPDNGTGGQPAGPDANLGGGTSNGGASVTPEPSRGPTPATDAANFPFPQNRYSERCTYPVGFDNQDVIDAFEKWRNDTVTADGAGGHLRVKRPNEPGLEVNSTVSEGIAYGMLIAVYMNDQELFDELWKYEQLWLDDRGLMHWYINAAGTEVLGTGAASDSDEDMAWALLMADRQWGGGGSLGDSYINIARDLINKIWQHEIHEGKLLKPGDQWGDWTTVNASYFAPSYYRSFAQVSGNSGWNDVVVTSYDTLENLLNDQNGNSNNGLVPAWATSDGVPNSGAWQDNSAPTHYQYDSCRTPFRVGLDYCFHAEPRALSYVQKTSSFFVPIGATSIVDGYELNGGPRPEFGHNGEQSAAFVGPAAVGAMSVGEQQFIDDAYSALVGLDLLVGGTYYDESWTVLSLLMLTGNFLDYTQHEPAMP